MKNTSFIVFLIFLSSIFTSCSNCVLPDNKSFKKNLKGKIVFARRDNQILNIYSISANGTDERILFENNDSINSNSFLPTWSKDGSKIYFTAMKKGKWKRWIMDEDGSNPRVVNSEEPLLLSRSSREKDIRVLLGSIYLADQNEPLYKHRNYDSKFNRGAREVSWSPDRNFIIFELKGYIYIIDKEGINTARITRGRDPDWKY